MKPMIRMVGVTMALVFLATATLHAQDVPDAGGETPVEEPAETGGWISATLADIDRYGARYRQPFIDEIVRYHGAPRELVVDLLGSSGWTPADVYYACAIAQLVGRPCRFVADRWPGARTGGWDAFAAGLGVEPGSVQFERLQQGLADSYRRWGRPLRVEDTAHEVEGAPRDD